jgi:predicted secreted acid phosphatase
LSTWYAAAGSGETSLGTTLSSGTCAVSARWVVALALVPSACASGSKPNAVPNLFDTQQQIAAYIDSGRYGADCAAVAAQARTYLDRRARQVPKPAAVFDIDETSLSNWPAYRVNGWTRFTAGECDLEKGPCGLRVWQAMAKSKAIPATLELVRHARSLGVAVFFISGRPPNLREATERNLHAEGYEWDGVVLLPEGAAFKSAADFKAPERRRLAEQGYTILISLGDQESDLAGGFAERTFKLPNPVYFLP